MPPPLLQSLSDQVDCYRRLTKLADLQHIYVQREQIEELLTILTQRQEVLDSIARLEVTIAPVRKQWVTYLATLSTEDRILAESLMAEARRLLEQITTSDRNDALALQQRKLNLGKQITQAKTARTINRTYATAAYGAAKPRLDLSR